MSIFEEMMTVSTEETSLLDRAAEKAIRLSRVIEPTECVALQQAVLWAVEFSLPFVGEEPTADNIAAVAMQARERFRPAETVPATKPA